MSRLRSLQTLVARVGAAAIVALIGSGASAGTQQDFITALVSATIVYGLYVFVGNSGVISFGHISFVAIGAFMAGVLTIPTGPSTSCCPACGRSSPTTRSSTFVSLVIAAGLGAMFALIVGLPLMRLSGIAAGIATFAVLEITYNVLQQWTKIGPGPTTLSLVPTTWGSGRRSAARCSPPWWPSSTSARGEAGCCGPAVRTRPRPRRSASTSRASACSRSRYPAPWPVWAEAMLVHQLGSITVDQVFLELTFLTLAMLVIGGSGSLWGATIGALAISLLDSWLAAAENTVHVIFFSVTLPNGAADLILGVMMAAMLLFRPTGITGGAEFSLGFIERLRWKRTAAGGLSSADTGNQPEAERKPLEHVEPVKPR